MNSVDQQIELKALPDDAWIFHTHDGAVTHARWIGEVHGETPNVAKLTRQVEPGLSVDEIAKRP